MASSFYEARVAPGGTARLGQASGGAFGTQLGEAVQGLGETLVQIDRNEKNAEAGLKAEQIKNEIEQYRDADQNGQSEASTADGLGHTVRVKQYGLKRMAEVLDGMDNDNDRRRMETHLTAFVNNQERRAAAYEVARRAQVGMDNVRDTIDQKTNRLARDGDMDMVNLELTGIKEQIYARTDVTPEQKDKLWKYAHTTIRGGFLNGLIRRDPATAQTLIDKGAFDDLDPDALEAAQRSIILRDVQIKNEAEAQARDALRLQISAEDAVLVKVDHGEVVDPEIVRSVVSARAARGDLDGAERAKGTLAEAEINAVYGDNNIPEMERDLALLTGRKDGQSILRRSALEKRLTRAREADPAFAPIDFDDPAQVQARIRLAEDTARQRGWAVPKFLSKDQVENMKELLASGATGRQQAINALAAFGGARARAAARQVAGDDLFLQGVVGLAPDRRVLAMAGAATLKANQALVPEKDARAGFGPAASALRMMGDYRESVFQVARAIAAEKQARAGIAEFDGATWEQSLHLALGGAYRGTEKLGGIGEWPDGTEFLLPEGMSQRAFDAAFNGITRPIDAFARGRRLSAREIREGYEPVSLPNGKVRFQDAYERTLMKRDGKTPWVFDARDEAGAAGSAGGAAGPAGRMLTRKEYEARGGHPIEYARYTQQWRDRLPDGGE